MSEYGRLWQKVADIRQELKKLLPEGSDTNTLANAIRSSNRAHTLVQEKLAEWAELEKQMSSVND